LQEGFSFSVNAAIALVVQWSAVNVCVQINYFGRLHCYLTFVASVLLMLLLYFVMFLIHAINMGAQEKLNTKSATATTATTKQSVTSEKLQKHAKMKDSS